MASVYEATDLRLTRKVALKVLTEELAEGSDFRERFLRESRFAASLDHPNIVPIYEAGEADGHLYIAMRYVRGNNLAEVLRKDGPFEPRRALAILSPVADALDAAHNAGLVHRDVKPANILLTAAAGRDGYEHVYLTDFGLTKATSALTKLTATGNFIGTMAYVSPEQIRGEPLDARTDLYAFGCVAYECLTGVPPFVRDDQAALLWAHLNEPPAAVSDHRGDLLPADSVMAKALAKNPSDRYQTCDEFTQALSDMLLTGRHSPSSVLITATPNPAGSPRQRRWPRVALRPPKCHSQTTLSRQQRAAGKARMNLQAARNHRTMLSRQQRARRLDRRSYRMLDDRRMGSSVHRPRARPPGRPDPADPGDHADPGAGQRSPSSPRWQAWPQF